MDTDDQVVGLGAYMSEQANVLVRCVFVDDQVTPKKYSCQFQECTSTVCQRIVFSSSFGIFPFVTF